VAANPLEGEAGVPKRQPLRQSHLGGAEAALRKLRALLRKPEPQAAVVEREEEKEDDHASDRLFYSNVVLNQFK
jgi:hypothetical protein